MARQQADRDDLFREARGLSQRVEFRIPAPPTNQGSLPADPVCLAGITGRGGVSIYLGQDYMLGFNARGELRRVHRHGLSYRAEKGRQLTELRRERIDDRPVNISRGLLASEMESLRIEFGRVVDRVRQTLAANKVAISRAAPEGREAEVVSNLLAVLKLVAEPPVIADGM
ncbi:hypothetical protein Pan216_34560 [Planctomycetes bacterium Pan216]|uniref:Uncharacterized protein n=1 Tax=Kolteria novifilia TaxID=2527975 RepID=A0A518B6I8_9BACT|nr:hypothetical protein Pan216_34560 [Planctomycetes bacterium Pan216]